LAVNLMPPSRQTGSTEDRLNGLYSYLYQLVEALNVSLGSAAAPAAAGSEAARGAVSAAKSGTDADSYQQLRSLIIKTAAEVTGSIRRTVTDIAHEYMAQSEFGTYEEYLSSRISQGADGVLMEWNAVNGITTSVAEFSQYIAESDVYIQVGIVKYNEDGTAEAGVVIGKNLQKVTVDGKELITSQNLYALFTAEELSFWQDGVCRARYGMVEFMVNKGYIDEITTSLLQSSTFGVQLAMRDDVLSAIAGSIDLAANESIKLIVQSTAAKELRTGTTVTITDEMFHVSSPETRFSIPSADSEEGSEIVSIDEEGMRTTVLTAESILSPSVVSTSAAAAHAPATAADMQVVLDSLSGKWMTGDVAIDASAVTAGSFSVKGLHGSGRLIITGGSFNGITVTDSSCIVEIRGSTLTAAAAAARVTNAKLIISGVYFSAATGITAADCGWVLAKDCTGICTTLANVTGQSEVRFTGSGQPYGLKGTEEGGIYSPYEFREYSETPETPAVSAVSITASLTRTYASSWLSTSSYGFSMYQGRYGENALRRGCMWFDTSPILGKQILSATLTLRRYSGVGRGGTVKTFIRGTTAASPSGAPPIGEEYVSISIANGETATVDVTNAVQALADGTINGLMLYDQRTDGIEGKTYTVGYARYYGTDTSDAPVLNITYQEAT